VTNRRETRHGHRRRIIVGAILGFLAYFVCALFLPYIVAVLVGVLVFLLVVFGGPRYYGRGVYVWTPTASSPTRPLVGV
jgi:ABC-type transport system involved in multi-copper enzyme maturation permease subunit